MDYLKGLILVFTVILLAFISIVFLFRSQTCQYQRWMRQYERHCKRKNHHHHYHHPREQQQQQQQQLDEENVQTTSTQVTNNNLFADAANMSSARQTGATFTGHQHAVGMGS